jgi:superfamily II DNA or RNA helicase
MLLKGIEVGVNRNEIRNKIQLKAVALSKSNQHLCLEWSTGVGKTLAAVKIVEEILIGNPRAKGYLVCKESTHKKNWKEDIHKHGKSGVLENINILLYASLSKCKFKADFVVLDECHGLTPTRIKHLRKVLSPGTKIILLSATIPTDKKMLISRLCKRVHYHTITLGQAIDLKLLPEPKLIVHKLYLKDQVEGKLWDFEYRKAKGKCLTTKYCSHKDLYQTLKYTPKEFRIVCQGTELEYYNAVTKMMGYYQDLSNSEEVDYNVRNGCHNKFLNLAITRKKFIAEVKTERAKELVDRFRDNNSRFICFAGSIDQINEIGSNGAIHSKNNKKKNQELIDCFNNKDCSELFAVKMLRESVNLTNIEKGIIIQLDSEIGSFYQMLGRCLRHEFPEMHVMVIMKTKDEEYIRKSMKNFNKKYITVC